MQLRKRGRAQVVEVTEAGRAFLVATFQRVDRDGDGALTPAELDELFSTAPATCAAHSTSLSTVSIRSAQQRL